MRLDLRRLTPLRDLPARQIPHLWSPRGRYGDAEGLTSDECTAECPTGKYNDKLGARTEDDCRLCPPGRYGSTTGLESKACSGACPSGKYSSVFGLTTDLLCVACPAAYRGWQCDEDAVPRKGFFDSTSGAINEEAHAYIGDTDGESDIPQGTSPITFESTYDLPLDNVA
ncbi:hypothetical protein CTAYLR_009785 [Chrysophaeum taylorii]|uniref:Tyrosine-protein kinase ephrin type A/B receptor-like domain-containing protein n=1 Tax=Chrysophaeum taylorii TaxID=2483200 RepID=A0AAD7UGC8_9STRA|nr:hypothetical protein CTAYLR_009785 [Chrysophaeum taylorii]